MIVLLFGPPGCGKGTQATEISKNFEIPAISTGDIFRAECKAGTELGKKACSIISSGGLVSDDVVNQIVAKRLTQPDCAGGFLLDGYPRTVAQAYFLDRFLEERGMPEAVVLHLDVSDDVLVARITARRSCPTCGHIYNLVSQPPKQAGLCDVEEAPLFQREDDTEAVIRQRLVAYKENTNPILKFYKLRNYHRIDGSRKPQQIQAEIGEILLKSRSLASV